MAPKLAVCELGIGGFNAARAVSTRNDDPAGASRPWDVDRDGFVLGEGAGVLVIEELEHAEGRGANLLRAGRLRCFGRRLSRHGAREDGDGARRCMLNAPAQCRDQPVRHRYVNARHLDAAWRYRRGDGGEGRVWRSHQKLDGQSTKSMTGHLLGAAAGFEAVFTILACTTA